jgi:hypothetical protein
MKRFKKSVIIPLTLFGAFILFLHWQSTPYYNKLEKVESEYIKELSENLTHNIEKEIDKIIYLNTYLYEKLPQLPYEDLDPHKITRKPSEMIKRGQGLCYDRSYLLEIMAESLGHKVRHIALSDGVTSHAVSEIKINGKWILFDSTYNEHYVSQSGELMSFREVHKNKETLITSYSPKVMNFAIYGVNSFHGKFFEPKIHFPDINLKQLTYNVFILDLIPYTYKSLHIIFFSIISIGILFFIYYKKPIIPHLKN